MTCYFEDSFDYPAVVKIHYLFEKELREMYKLNITMMMFVILFVLDFVINSNFLFIVSIFLFVYFLFHYIFFVYYFNEKRFELLLSYFFKRVDYHE